MTQSSTIHTSMTDSFTARPSVQGLADGTEQIHEKLLKLVRLERRITSEILDLLQSLENSRAYLKWGYAHLFDYLVRGLGYSESLAYQRKAALQICKELPEIKGKLNSGEISISLLAKANRVLKTQTTDEKRSLLLELENKPGREQDRILAKAEVRHAAKLDGHTQETAEVGAAGLVESIQSPVSQSPVSAKRYVKRGCERRYLAGGEGVRVAVDLTQEEFELLEKLRALKSHSVRNYKELFVGLVKKELQKYQPREKHQPRQKRQLEQKRQPQQKCQPEQKLPDTQAEVIFSRSNNGCRDTRSDSSGRSSRTSRPGGSNRSSRDGGGGGGIGSNLKKELLRKANYRCQYPGCQETHFLQIDHIHPKSKGGGNNPENLQVLCFYHNNWKSNRRPED